MVESPLKPFTALPKLEQRVMLAGNSVFSAADYGKTIADLKAAII
jgi:hypothetical protein